jgi:hypothetical protein
MSLVGHIRTHAAQHHSEVKRGAIVAGLAGAEWSSGARDFGDKWPRCRDGNIGGSCAEPVGDAVVAIASIDRTIQ